MKEYIEFLKNKKQTRIDSGFEINDDLFNKHLFDFQKYCVKRALKAGKFAMFEDCGLGKTIQQLEWAYQVVNHIDMPTIIFAPLGVVPQTIQEGAKFGYNVEELGLTIFDQH